MPSIVPAGLEATPQHEQQEQSGGPERQPLPPSPAPPLLPTLHADRASAMSIAAIEPIEFEHLLIEERAKAAMAAASRSLSSAPSSSRGSWAGAASAVDAADNGCAFAPRAFTLADSHLVDSELGEIYFVKDFVTVEEEATLLRRCVDDHAADWYCTAPTTVASCSVPSLISLPNQPPCLLYYRFCSLPLHVPLGTVGTFRN